MDPENKRALIAAIRHEAPFLVLGPIVFFAAIWPLRVWMLPAESIAGQRLWALGIMFVVAFAVRPLFEMAWSLVGWLQRRRASG